MSSVAEAVRDGVLPGRVWFYANYHCNLACSYCLTESDPRAERRELGEQRMLTLARQAAELGFTALGVTGGEPFLLPYLPELLAKLAAILPLVCLSNGTVLTERRLERLRPLAGLPAQIQVSLDRPEPQANDAMRAPENFRKVVDAIPRLVERGVRVRIATTVDAIDDEERERLCRLHRRLGVPDADHVIRPIVRRGRAVDHDLGVEAGPADLPAELTITTDGAFWSPFGPTVHGGRLDTDLLIRPATIPTSTRPLRAAHRRAAGRWRRSRPPCCLAPPWRVVAGRTCWPGSPPPAGCAWRPTAACWSPTLAPGGATAGWSRSTWPPAGGRCCWTGCRRPAAAASSMPTWPGRAGRPWPPTGPCAW